MKTAKSFRIAVLTLALVCTPALCRADITLTLSKTFVEKYKNRATVDAQLSVDAHLNKPHKIGTGGDDGDIHMAGRSDQVRLPLVAEIMNAGLKQPAEAQALQELLNTSGDQPIAVGGFWRIWFEHLGKNDQTQGDPVPVPANSNPDHLFEIHPLTSFEDTDLLNSLIPIPGYQAYPAQTAFGKYESLKCTIQANDTAIMITGGEVGYNYAEFVIEPAGKVQPIDDGYVVLAHVYDVSNPEEGVTSDLHRMIFVKGSAPADALLKLPKGERLHVLGLPRVSLAEVAAVADANGTTPADVNMPYEMIVAAVLPPVE
jgi:hypothetical protein